VGTFYFSPQSIAPGSAAGGILGGTLPNPNALEPLAAGYTSFATGDAANLLNSTSGGNAACTAGTYNYAALYIPYTVTLTGLILVTGGTGGTDEWIAALWTAAGVPLAHSALAGQLAQAANTKAAFPFTAPLVVNGPTALLAGFQSNGNTARYLAFPNAVEGFVTGQQAGAFGTIGSFTPATTFSTGIGPFVTTY